MIFAENYKRIGLFFERALDGLNVEPAFKGAIKTMQVCPEQITNIKSFNDTLWELIETVCNKNIIPIEDEERWDYFIGGCTLLEQYK